MDFTILSFWQLHHLKIISNFWKYFYSIDKPLELRWWIEDLTKMKAEYTIPCCHQWLQSLIEISTHFANNKMSNKREMQCHYKIVPIRWILIKALLCIWPEAYRVINAVFAGFSSSQNSGSKRPICTYLGSLKRP
jgi:hypothetical protein